MTFEALTQVRGTAKSRGSSFSSALPSGRVSGGSKKQSMPEQETVVLVEGISTDRDSSSNRSDGGDDTFSLQTPQSDNSSRVSSTEIPREFSGDFGKGVNGDSQLWISNSGQNLRTSDHLTVEQSVHVQIRNFIRRHEIPRKALHVSIGFLVTYLYRSGQQPMIIRPVLMSLLIPVTLTDVIRHRSTRFNQLYSSVLGPLMRESEMTGYNGVIYYLAGTWAVMQFCPKDVGIISILLLSWCDTAASTFGRLYGRYTPKIRNGKSLAGSLAAFLTGVAAAAIFWGWLGPKTASLGYDIGENAFSFQGQLRFPLPSFIPSIAFPSLSSETSNAAMEAVSSPFWWSGSVLTLSGNAALGAASLYAGFAASASEAVDLFGLDDNLTIPVLCGVSIWGFLKLFG